METVFKETRIPKVNTQVKKSTMSFKYPIFAYDTCSASNLVNILIEVVVL